MSHRSRVSCLAGFLYGLFVEGFVFGNDTFIGENVLGAFSGRFAHRFLQVFCYTVYDVIGWRARRGKPVLKIAQDIPDRYWFGAKPRILTNQRGKDVDKLIDEVERAARAYPWKTIYKAFPGPNSNTFTAWVAKQVPELNLDLPFNAIGKGYVD